MASAPTGNGNGNGKPRPTTAAGMLSSLSERVIAELPSQFLALIIVNAVFLIGLFWFVDARANHTAAVLNQLLQACLKPQ